MNPVEATASIIAISTGICTAAYFIYRQLKKKQIEYRKLFNGKFTNEGEVYNPKPPYITIKIDVDVRFGDINGWIECYEDEDFRTYDITGKVKSSSAKLNISFAGNRTIRNMAKAKVKLVKRHIHWSLLEGDISTFPNKALLWKSPV